MRFSTVQQRLPIRGTDMSTAHPIFDSIDWVALGWVLELGRLPEDSRVTDPNHQLLMLWYRAGSYSGSLEQAKQLQRLVVDWGGVPFAKRVIPGAKYPVAIMVPLVDAFIVAQQTKQRPKQAAMRAVRDYSSGQRKALHEALTKLSRDRIGKALLGRLMIEDQGQFTLAASIGEALDLLMRDIEDYVFGASKASVAGLLGT